MHIVVSLLCGLNLNVMELQFAQKIAEELVEKLKPHCIQVYIAGSIRRKRPDVKDIEIVVMPRRIIERDLFGFVKSSTVEEGFANAVKKLGTLQKGGPNMKYARISVEKGVMLDLFIPSDDDFFRILAIRTGDHLFSIQIMGASKKKGWCGTDQGLRKISDCRPVLVKHKDNSRYDKTIWKVDVANPELPPVWRSERDFFDWIGLEYIEPEFRNLKKSDKN